MFPLGVEVWPSEGSIADTVLQKSLGTTSLNCGVQVLSLY